MLGVPGFASGGIARARASPAPALVSSLVRADLQKIAAAANQKIGRLTPTTGAGGGGGGGFPVNVPGSLTSWLQTAMGIAGVSGPLWLAMLQRQAIRESGGNPNAINLTDSPTLRPRRQPVPASESMQTTGTTFSEYGAARPRRTSATPSTTPSPRSRWVHHRPIRRRERRPRRRPGHVGPRRRSACRPGGIHGISTALALAGQAPTPLASRSATRTVTGSVAQINRILDPTTGTSRRTLRPDRLHRRTQQYDQINGGIRDRAPRQPASTPAPAASSPRKPSTGRQSPQPSNTTYDRSTSTADRAAPPSSCNGERIVEPDRAQEARSR